MPAAAEPRRAWRGRDHPAAGWRCCSNCGRLLAYFAFTLRCMHADCELVDHEVG